MYNSAATLKNLVSNKKETHLLEHAQLQPCFLFFFFSFGSLMSLLSRKQYVSKYLVLTTLELLGFKTPLKSNLHFKDIKIQTKEILVL